VVAAVVAAVATLVVARAVVQAAILVVARAAAVKVAATRLRSKDPMISTTIFRFRESSS
jgi:hypothetical protein